MLSLVKWMSEMAIIAQHWNDERWNEDASNSWWRQWHAWRAWDNVDEGWNSPASLISASWPPSPLPETTSDPSPYGVDSSSAGMSEEEDEDKKPTRKRSATKYENFILCMGGHTGREPRKAILK